MSNNDHHINGPSALLRRQECPGSARMEAGLLEPPGDNEDRDRGVLIHAIVAGGEGELPDDDARYIADAWHEAVARMTEAIGVECRVHREVRLELYDDYGELLTFGTSDLILEPVDGSPGAVLDLKTGRGEYPDLAQDDPQLGAYGLMAADHFGWPSVTVQRVQPLLGQYPDYTWEDIGDLREWITGIIEGTRTPELWLATGSHCTYCRARPICPQVRAEAAEVAAVTPADIIDPYQLRDWYERAKVAAPLCEQIAKMAKEAAATEGGLPGYKLRKSRGRMYCADPAAMWARMEAAGITLDAFQSALTVSVSAARKLWEQANAEAMEGVTKKALDAEWEAMITDGGESAPCRRGAATFSVVADRGA